MYEFVLLLYVEIFDGDNVNDQVDGDCKFCCYMCVCVCVYIYYLSIYLHFASN